MGPGVILDVLDEGDTSIIPLPEIKLGSSDFQPIS